MFAKPPFASPSQILDYLGRYTHRVAIANGRLLDCQDGRVSFRWKDYRAQNKSKAMTLDADEFMRRFLMHVLPKGFRRIRHFGFLANSCCRRKLGRIRAALAVPNECLGTNAVRRQFNNHYLVAVSLRADNRFLG